MPCGQSLPGAAWDATGSALLGYSVWQAQIPAAQLPQAAFSGTLALSVGALTYAFAVTALGLLFSAMVRTQVAALFLAAIVCIILSSNFAGLLCPVSTLPPGAHEIGMGFPAAWFQLINLGAITKGLSFDLGYFGPEYAALIGFGLGYLLLARAFVRKQEA